LIRNYSIQVSALETAVCAAYSWLHYHHFFDVNVVMIVGPQDLYDRVYNVIIVKQNKGGLRCMHNVGRKKRGITIKVALKDLDKESVYDKVKNYLKENTKYGYTISGLLVEIFGYKAEELNAPFRDWPKGAPSQYTRVRLALQKMVNEKLVVSTKYRKGFLYSWKQ